MSNSYLVDYVKISPNKNTPRKYPITKITIHHMAGNLTVEQCGNVFAPVKRQASSNYGIGTDGRVGMYVEEKDRAWTSSNADNDNRAVTIEVANDQIGGNWHVSDKALSKLIDLCTDICKRNGIESLNYTGDKSGNLTMHKWFANTACPGPYLSSKFPYIAQEVNKRLQNGSSSYSEIATFPDPPFVVDVIVDDLNYRSEPSMRGEVKGQTGKGSFTIVEVSNGWGKLKSGIGWIYLGNSNYCTVPKAKSVWDTNGPWRIEGATGNDKTALKEVCEKCGLTVSNI